ncbi:MAG: response regulator transcription factor [Thiohalobacterales bacterium]|nr:response regulator transcription factor [Thiohalobacterales bacterium]
MMRTVQREILLVEDNPEIAHLVMLHLGDTGMQVTHAANGDDGLRLALERPFDLLILDLMLPGIDGMEICRAIRRNDTYTPVLMLTARTSELDRVLGLETGADDYLTKPFSIRELVARVKALLRRVESCARRSADTGAGILKLGDLEINPATRIVRMNRRPVDLTAREFDLLWHFASNPGRVFTRSQLLDNVWGYGHEGYEHTVNSHINRLRAKIEDKPSSPRYVLTVWGVGYRFATPEDSIATR